MSGGDADVVNIPLCRWRDVESEPATNYQKRNPVYSTPPLTGSGKGKQMEGCLSCIRRDLVKQHDS
jgi:hypothetical protein